MQNNTILLHLQSSTRTTYSHQLDSNYRCLVCEKPYTSAVLDKDMNNISDAKISTTSQMYTFFKAQLWSLFYFLIRCGNARDFFLVQFLRLSIHCLFSIQQSSKYTINGLFYHHTKSSFQPTLRQNHNHSTMGAHQFLVQYTYKIFSTMYDASFNFSII